MSVWEDAKEPLRIEDLLAARDEILDRPFRPPIRLHSPSCRAVETGDFSDCDCIPLPA